MTIINGNIQDIGLAPLSGVLVATSVIFRTTGDIVIAPESRSFPIAAGVVSADLVPGPTRLTVQVGAHARDEFDVVVPDAGPVTLAVLIAEAFEWTPDQVSEFVRLRDEAVAAADRAETAAEDVDSAIAGAADQVVAAVEEDRVAAEGAAASAATSAGVASTQAGVASGHAGDAAASATTAGTRATAAAGSATAAAGSASDAASSAGLSASSASDASTARAAAVAAQGGAESAATDAALSASEADGHATRAETAANSFDLTATSSTGAPGSAASVTVTGDGPAYGLALSIPRGDKGDTGPAGEVSQAALDAAVATLVGGAPAALDTLDELASALGNDPNFATTVSTEIGLRAKTTDVNTALAGKANTSHSHTIAQVTGLQAALDDTAADWDDLSGKPTSFPPSAHSHAWSEITSKPTTFAPATHSHSWAQVTGKPTTFAPSTHTHTKAQVGLGSVDNTSDAAKPVSTATAAAINAKIQLVSSFPASPTAGVLYLKAE